MAIRLTIPKLPSRVASPATVHARMERQGDIRLSEDGLAARLQQEAAALSVLYRTPTSYGCDPILGFWLHVERYPLPEGSDPDFCPVILLVPRDFPAVAPTTMYLPVGMTVHGLHPSCFLPTIGAAAPEQAQWLSCGVPQITWRKGDDLDRLFSALGAVLHAVASASSAREGSSGMTEQRQDVSDASGRGEVVAPN